MTALVIFDCDGVRVNAVAPTYINTPLNAFVKSNPEMYDAWIGGTPMGRMGEVDEVASAVLFLPPTPPA